jgi:hypothetical protein
MDVIMKIKEIVKGNKAIFTHYKNDHLYYNVIDHKTNNPICSVPINIDDKEDIGHATYNAEIKAISIMRYINKAKKNESLAFYGEFIDSGSVQEQSPLV